MTATTRFILCATILSVTTTIQPASVSRTLAAPPPLRVHLAQRVLKPGGKQIVTVLTAPRTPIFADVTFPDERFRHRHGKADAAGSFIWTFTQPASTIRRHARTATVQILSGSGADTALASVKYTVRPSLLDVSVEPSPPVTAGDSIAFWIHSRPSVAIRLSLIFQDGTTLTLQGRTGPDGWAQNPYAVPVNVYLGQVTAVACARVHGRSLSATTTFQIPSTGLLITNTQVLHRNGTGWVPTTEIHLGEDVRFYAEAAVREEAGWFIPPGPIGGGIVRVLKDGKLIFSAQLHDATPSGSSPYVYADTRFTDPSQVGELAVQITLTRSRDIATLHFMLDPAP